MLQRVRRFARQRAFGGHPRGSGVVRRIGFHRARGHLARARRFRRSAPGRAAHFNHQLRGDAEQDERLSASVARSACPLLRIAGTSRGLGEARVARGCRPAGAYEFFERARQQLVPTSWRSATHAQSGRTFLLRLVRRAGPRGLAAMRGGAIIRRSSTVAGCSYGNARRAEHPVATMRQRRRHHPRNRVRGTHPLLSDRVQPAIVDALAHQAELSREIWAYSRSATNSLTPTAPGLLRRSKVGTEPGEETSVISSKSSTPVGRQPFAARGLAEDERSPPVVQCRSFTSTPRSGFSNRRAEVSTRRGIGWNGVVPRSSCSPDRSVPTVEVLKTVVIV